MDLQTVTMTPEQLAEFEAYKADKEKKSAAQKAKDDREAYKTLVDEQIDAVFPILQEVSAHLAKQKNACVEAFGEALQMKASIFGVKSDQRSHTFTNSDSTRRVILGRHTTDAYRDTVEDGVAIVKESISALAKDENSQMLVNAVFRLLSRDQQGNLKASRVLQLRKMAEESQNERFVEGVRIIEEAYQPAESKQFIRAEYRNEDGAWVNIPLGMTEAEITTTKTAKKS